MWLHTDFFSFITGLLSELSVGRWVSLQLSSLARSVTLGGRVTCCTQLSAEVKDGPPLSVHDITGTTIRVCINTIKCHAFQTEQWLSNQIRGVASTLIPLTWPGNREYSLSSDRSTGTCWPPCSGPASNRTDCAFSLPLLSQQIWPNTVILSYRWTEVNTLNLAGRKN